MKENATKEYMADLYQYFIQTGVYTEEYLSILKNHLDWPSLKGCDNTTLLYNLISIPVTLLLSKISAYMVALQDKKLFLSLGIGYWSVTAWYIVYIKKNSIEKFKKLSATKGAQKCEKKKQFKVPNFCSDTLDGDDYIRLGEILFRSNTISIFSESISH